MIQVTDTAAHVIQMLLETNEVADGHCLRLTMKTEGQYGFDVVPEDSDEEEDHTFDHEGQRVLIVGSDVGARLAGMTLDAQQNEDGQVALALIPPGEGA